MILLPLPIVLAMIFGFLALRMAIAQRPVPVLAVLLAMLAGQALINALAVHYGIALARFVQPVTALAIPAAAWLAWRSDAMGLPLHRHDVVHGLGPIFALAMASERSLWLEVVVPAAYAGYGVALARALLRNGPDLPRAKLGQGGAPRLIWAGIAAALIASALSDLVIAAFIAMGDLAYVPRLVDLGTTALLLGLGALAIMAQGTTGHADIFDDTLDHGSDVSAPPSQDDTALFARLEAMMAQRSPWRDPDITLATLARRLHVPAKSLSIAVNRVSGQNISRYINEKRVAAALASLGRGSNVTEAMLESGFATKSNFNREFRRITGKNPSDFVLRR